MITILTPRFISFFLLLWIIGGSSFPVFHLELSSPVFTDSRALNFRSECLRMPLSTRAASWGIPLWLCHAIL